MIEMIVDVLSEAADILIDLWVNKIVRRRSRK